MSFRNRSFRRVWDFHPASYGIRSTWAQARSAFGGAPRPWRVLLASDGAAYTSEQQFAPWARHLALSSTRFGAVVQHRSLVQALQLDAAALRRFDAIGLKMAFNTPTTEAEKTVRHFAAAVDGSPTRLVYFDGDDDPNVQWPSVLEAVHLYIKKHVHADLSGYTRRYVGKTNLTDFVARAHGVSFDADIIPSSPGVEPAHVAKIHLGWNIALDDKIAELAVRMAELPDRPRDIDVSCRAAVPRNVWTHVLREPALERIDAMQPRFRVLAPRDRVGQAAYYDEMLRSKICVSPFGYGEICWRDFEAVLCGCLLVKPDMSHLRTDPDIFVAGETYVPVRWNFDDLEETCAYYLDRPSERQAIVDAARRKLLQALEPEWFIGHLQRVVDRLRGFPATA